MTTLNKDQSIVLQVAAKIATDLVINNPAKGDLQGMTADFAMTMPAIYEMLADMHSWDSPVSTAQAVSNVMAAFPNSVVEEAHPMTNLPVTVKGKQHGPIPEWLLHEAAAAGVREVWDNRDQLSINPKRPHFKATQGDKAFWPPKGR